MLTASEVSDVCNWTSLAEIVEVANTNISNENDADRGSDCKVGRAGKLDIEITSDWLLICFTFMMKSPGSIKNVYGE